MTDRCTTHPNAPAGWTCQACNRYLCSECVADPAEIVTVCGHCRGFASQIDEQAPAPAPAGPPSTMPFGADPPGLQPLGDEEPLELDLDGALDAPAAPAPATSGLELDLNAPVVEAKLDLAPPPEAKPRTESEIERDMGGTIELDDSGLGASPGRPAHSPPPKAPPPSARPAPPTARTPAPPEVPVVAGTPAPLGAAEEGGALKAALERGDEARAYELFFESAGSGVYPKLEPRLNLRLAGVLEKVNAFDEAVRACQRAAKEDMSGPFAPKAIFMAARIMGERAGNTEGAKAMYAFLVKNFPDDDLAVRARQALERLG